MSVDSKRFSVVLHCCLTSRTTGAQHNEACVRAIAVTGHGNYYYIANPDDIPVAVRTRLQKRMCTLIVTNRVVRHPVCRLSRWLDGHRGAKVCETIDTFCAFNAFRVYSEALN